MSPEKQYQSTSELLMNIKRLEDLITPTSVVAMPKQMISESTYQLIYHCPNCGSYLRHTTHNDERQFGNSTIMKDNELPMHCPFCGQALKWAEDGEKNEHTQDHMH